MGANAGRTLDEAHWSTWAPLDNTGSWGGGCGPGRLPVTHWTLPAEKLWDEVDKEALTPTVILSPGFLLFRPLTHWTRGLIPDLILEHTPLLPTLCAAARTSQSLYVSVE